MFMHACTVYNSKEKGIVRGRLIYLYVCALVPQKMIKCTIKYIWSDATGSRVVFFLIIYLYSYNYHLQPIPIAMQQLQQLFDVIINVGFSKLICYKFYNSIFYAYVTQPLLHPTTIHHNRNANDCSLKACIIF